VLPFTLKCTDAPLSRPDTRTFMPTYEPLAPAEVAVVVVPEDELWEEPVAAAYEGAESVRSSPQAHSVALPISARMRRVTSMNAMFNPPSRSVIPNCVFGFIAHPPG
jgi:hypothetical protein